MERSTLSLLFVCIFIIAFCAFVAPTMKRIQIEAYEDKQQTTDVTATASQDKPSGVLPNPQVLESKRQSLIENMIRNLYFLCVYPGMASSLQNDVSNLYKSVLSALKMQLGSFDVLCQDVDIKSPSSTAIEAKLKDSCNKFYIDLFSQEEDTMYPGYDTAFTELLTTTTHKDNSRFNLDANIYQITKNLYSPEYVKYTFDTNSGLIRMNFYNDKGVSIPTYLVLALPFAVEYEQLGIFNIVFDVNPAFNIFNSYNSTQDNTQKSVYLSPVPTLDSKKNFLNYLDQNFALQNIANVIDTTPRFRQMRVYYTNLIKPSTQTRRFHNMTVALNKKSAGTLSISYNGDKTSLVNTTIIGFANNKLDITVDTTQYTDLVADINSVLASDSTSDFDLFVTLSFNILTVILMYKRNIYEHHVIFKRTVLLNPNASTPYMKVFAFDPELDSATNYVNGHNGTFKVMTYVPNFLSLSQSLGYNFRI